MGWTNSGGGAILNPGKWLSSAIASLTAPLFNKGTNIANLKIAQARQQEATLRFEQALLNARLTLAQNRIGKIQAVVHLYHALGGGNF